MWKPTSTLHLPWLIKVEVEFEQFARKFKYDIWVTSHLWNKLLKENMLTQAINSCTNRIYQWQLIFEICTEIDSNNRNLHPLHISKQQKVKYGLEKHLKHIQLQILLVFFPNSFVKSQIIVFLAKIIMIITSVYAAV